MIDNSTVAAAQERDFGAMSAINEATDAQIIAIGWELCSAAGRNDLHDDITQAGRLTVWASVDGFDAERGVPFVGYALAHARTAMQKELRALTRPGIPDAVMWRFQRLVEIAEGDMDAALKLAATTTFSGKKLSRETFIALRDAMAPVWSLDRPERSGGNRKENPSGTLTVGDTIPDPNEWGNPEAATIAVSGHAGKRERRELAHALLALLTPTKARVLRMTYGIAPEEECADKAIAAELGITDSTVRAHRNQALKTLRAKGQALFAEAA